MPSRADRRRKRRTAIEDGPRRRGLPFGRTERFALGFLAFGLASVGIAAVIVSSTGGHDSTEVVANTPTTAVTVDPNVTSNGSPQDEADITALARRSIEVLPRGEWPSLYEDFTLEFRGRCDRAVFIQAGVDSAASLGDSLQLLEFKEMKALTITGDTATGTIVGRYRDTEDSDYDIQAAFAREDRLWKISTAPNTTGCSAFNQLGN